jgi:hypothetical protein
MKERLTEISETVEYVEKGRIKNDFSWLPVARACNPSYTGGRDPEDHGSKPA